MVFIPRLLCIDNTPNNNQIKMLVRPDLLGEFSTFLSQIEQSARDAYPFVAVRERRAFNYIYDRWKDKVPFLTTAGLLLYSREMAKRYLENDTFPKVLLVDDLAIYGRGLSNFLERLRRSVWAEVRLLCPDKELSYRLFQRSFRENVQVCVYAASPYSMFLLESGIRRINTYSGTTTPMSEIHDLSMQFSYELQKLPIANTSFVLSAFPVESHIGELPRVFDSDKSDWVATEWQYEGEPCQFLLRPWGQGRIKGISTVRIFPKSAEGAPAVLMGELPAEASEEICRKYAEIAKELNLHEIAELLELDAGRYAVSKSQLLSFFVSVADMIEVRNAAANLLDWGWLKATWRTDAEKIAYNFRMEGDLAGEFSDLTVLPELYEKLLRPLAEELKEAVAPLLPQMSPEQFLTAMPRKPHLSFIEQCTDLVEQYLYQIGFNDEERARELKERSYLFTPIEYQKDSNAVGVYGTDGIVDIREFLNNLLQLSQSSAQLAGCIVAFLTVMDRGLVGVRESIREDGTTHLIAKAGELSSFYCAKKLAPMIPALAYVEKFSYRRAPSKREAVKHFFRVSKVVAELCQTPEKREECERCIDSIYDCGQSLEEWNFWNMSRIGEKFSEIEALLEESKCFFEIKSLTKNEKVADIKAKQKRRNVNGEGYYPRFHDKKSNQNDWRTSWLLLGIRYIESRKELQKRH